MSKNAKKQPFKGGDNYQRMVFLYRAALSFAGSNNMLSSQYGQLCRKIGQKSLLRFNPEMKRKLCKRCSVGLIPDVTVKITDCPTPVLTNQPKKKKVKNKQKFHKTGDPTHKLTCLVCGFERMFWDDPAEYIQSNNDDSTNEENSLETDKCTTNHNHSNLENSESLTTTQSMVKDI